MTVIVACDKTQVEMFAQLNRLSAQYPSSVVNVCSGKFPENITYSIRKMHTEEHLLICMYDTFSLSTIKY